MHILGNLSFALLSRPILLGSNSKITKMNPKRRNQCEVPLIKLTHGRAQSGNNLDDRLHSWTRVPYSADHQPNASQKLSPLTLRSLHSRTNAHHLDIHCRLHSSRIGVRENKVHNNDARVRGVHSCSCVQENLLANMVWPVVENSPEVICACIY